MFANRSFERTTPIFFNKLLTKQADDVGKFLELKRHIFSLANTHSLIEVIRLGEQITLENLEVNITFFKRELNGLVTRLPEIYSVYRLFAHKVWINCFINNFTISLYALLFSVGKKICNRPCNMQSCKRLLTATHCILTNISPWARLFVRRSP